MSTLRKPTRRPDDKAHKAKLEAAYDEMKALGAQIAALSTQFDAVSVGADSVARRKELQAQLKEVIAKQGAIKSEKALLQTQIRAAEEAAKRKIAEMEKITGKHAFRSVAEIDARIAQLDTQVSLGDLKLAEERRLIKEMTALRKLRKDYAEVARQQAGVDADKKKVADLKAALSALGARELAAQFELLQLQLQAVDEGNKPLVAKRAELKAKKDALHKAKAAQFDRIQLLRAAHDAEYAKYKQAIADEQQRRAAEHEALQAERRQARLERAAQRKLAAASVPAFSHEIAEIHSLLERFEPGYARPAAAPAKRGDSGIDVQRPTRAVEMPADVVIVKKTQATFVEGLRGKKTKKKAKKFALELDVILQLADLAVPLPAKEEDVPETVRILKETLAALEEKQDEQTAKNIARAKEEVAKLQPADLSDLEED